MTPTPFLLCVVALWFVIYVIALWIPQASRIASIVGSAWVLLALADAVAAFFVRLPKIEREAPSSFIQGKFEEIRLRVSGLSRLIRRLDIFDGAPVSFESDDLPLRLKPRAKGVSDADRAAGRLEVAYRAIPTRRGSFRYERAHVRFLSPLGAWSRRFHAGTVMDIRVYPSYRPEERDRLLLMAGVSEAGSIRPVRRRGHGTEFHQLRDYREGDPIRLVDWKATSRVRKLIVKELQEEQNQELVFLLDTGYRMYARDGERSHFDLALEGLLYLAEVALKQGDAVGLMTFGPKERWIAPRKGSSALTGLISGTYDLEAESAPSSPSAALEDLAARLSRRSLIVLISNLREEDAAGLDPRLDYILREHLLVTLWIREQVIETLLKPPFQDLRSSLTAAAAHRYLDDRERLQALWKRRGIQVIDTTPAHLSANLINSYWEIKRGGWL